MRRLTFLLTFGLCDRGCDCFACRGHRTYHGGRSDRLLLHTAAAICGLRFPVTRHVEGT
jgi:hypothetical protein